MKVLVYGAGATGARAARFHTSMPQSTSVTIVERDQAVADEVARSLGNQAETASIDALRLESRLSSFASLCNEIDVVVLATGDDHLELARTAVDKGSHVVSVSDDLETVLQLQELDHIARRAEVSLVLGAGFSPGLTCLLAVHAARRLDVVDEIHVAKYGTGGPECARQHHRALRTDSLDWYNRDWERRRGGSGRELCWFPDPVGGLDCYHAALPDSTLLLSAFPELVRATARVAATRRDRVTKWLPMMRHPHPEGLVGAVRVEVRGWSGSVRASTILGALDRPAVAAGAVAATAAAFAYEKRFVRAGAGGLAELIGETSPFLQKLSEQGVKAAKFEGTSATP